MNNKSKKPEKFEPQDSDQKNVHHPGEDDEAVVKPADKDYNEDDAGFKNPAKQREKSEQPVNPVKKAPEE